MLIKMAFLTRLVSLLLIICQISSVIGENDEEVSTDRYVIEGKVFPPENAILTGWQLMTHVMANGGEHLGYLREDGSFTISNVPSGSYIIEVVNPNYAYEPVRVEINSKGKFRARKVNLIQTSQVIQVPYPLKMRPFAPFRYFQLREQWRVTDFLFNPMVLMMILPLLLIMVLPKIMNDPETRKIAGTRSFQEMEQLNSLTKYDMPEMSEMITTFFAGEEKQKSKAVKAAKKRQ
ncbi:ER membrane protein complex subunit 7 homolog isoform X1 [Neodiprion pinetum]|uniref:ER membrane protein complex subunit 7 homolog isoform X1 n=1 Tax=Neodiprion lecontei TaxID=441921 RepID=A0ABM3G3C8_NEOLC|nr:ER membrane protein complex subunit 7 homolog isoform X1 [Neodiprion fabricii]XP_046480138.1 ER membrane protein complex subunit 7 homolog isoform X1 [Neodiprion pinetum]XP_046594776.1 ER membrane protein complex subunit 7 homolog isoform X1 [Neodiprion lecontei]